MFGAKFFFFKWFSLNGKTEYGGWFDIFSKDFKKMFMEDLLRFFTLKLYFSFQFCFLSTKYKKKKKVKSIKEKIKSIKMLSLCNPIKVLWFLGKFFETKMERNRFSFANQTNTKELVHFQHFLILLDIFLQD